MDGVGTASESPLMPSRSNACWMMPGGITHASSVKPETSEQRYQWNPRTRASKGQVERQQQGAAVSSATAAASGTGSEDARRSK